MRRSGRIISITLSAVGILALGFVVSVAAKSVPGRGAEEPLLDGAWRPGFDVTTVLTWLVLIAAVIGAVILALSTREPRPPGEQKRRGLMVLVLGIVVFALVARYMRSVAETILPETSEVIGEAEAAPIVDSAGSNVWLFSLLVAAIIVAALARVGMTIRSGAPPSQDLEAEADPSQPSVTDSYHVPPARGTDPRGRILGAYFDFERDAGEAGIPREPSETAARHAGRAHLALSLEDEEMERLSRHHADARFGPDEPSAEAASEAESAWQQLRRQILG